MSSAREIELEQADVCDCHDRVAVPPSRRAGLSLRSAVRRQSMLPTRRGLLNRRAAVAVSRSGFEVWC